MKSSKGKAAAPGTTAVGIGKSAVRTTMTAPFGKRGGKRSAGKRAGRSR